MKKSLREQFDNDGLIVAPGTGDALTARLIEEAGFSCVSISGYQTAGVLGYPDVGLVTMSEMVAQAAHICAAVDIPVIADADNGHGNVINTIRTVREFEQAGASAIYLEDQHLPKKCGHMSGHVLISPDEMCGKVKAAVDTRRSPDFLVIARTDAIASQGLEAAIGRGQAYRASGADAVMVMAPRSIEDLKEFRAAVEGPLVTTVGSWGFAISADQLQALGYKVAMYPLTTMRRAIVAMRDVLHTLRVSGQVDHDAADMTTMHDLHCLLGLPAIQEQERRFGNVHTE